MGIWVLIGAGFALGFVGSIPVAGPIALLVFTLVVEGEHRRAVFIAVGAGVAEGIYAFLAFWGASELLTAHPALIPISRGIAAVILGLIGFALVRRKPSAAPPIRRTRPSGGLLLGFGITALNPTLIGTWSAAVTVLFSTGLVTFTRASSLTFGLSATVGVATWFILLVLLGRRFTDRFRQETLDRTIHVMGWFALLLALGFAIATAACFIA